jgi:hypothetical protein
MNPNASASDLTQALMASLRTMQMHSNMVRDLYIVFARVTRCWRSGASD